MSKQTKEQVDLRGLTCPEPVIRTKKLFDNADVNVVEALVDDDVCVNNLQRLANSLKAVSSVQDKGKYFAVTIERGAQPHTHPAVHESKPKTQERSSSISSTGTVLFLTSDELGRGDPDFSKTLINLFLQTAFDSGLHPRAILLINSGVRLLDPNAQTLKVLNDFKAAGVEVLACGLCLDYYKIKELVPKEQITNMFAICEYLFAADRVLQP